VDDFENDLSILRALAARELETINHYQRLADSSDAGSRDFFLHVLVEEKLHVAQALEMIAKLDPDQTELMRTGFRSGHRSGEIPLQLDPVVDAEPVVEAAPRPALTVGSLRGVPQDSSTD
jgi:hypothetical protein